MLRNAVILLLLTGISLQAQTPNISNGLPAESFAGEPVSFTLNWDNTGSPGFGPYYRLILPPDITLDSASFLGSGVTIEDLGVFPIAPGNTIADPRSGTDVTGTPGSRLQLLVFPVGSVVTGGPTLGLNIGATISTAAVVGTPLDVTVQPVYQFGDTATGDNGPIIGTADTQQITPTVVTLSKAPDNSEGERPPGPSFPIEFVITVDVANGKTVFDLDITDTLDPDLQYVAASATVGGSGAQAGVVLDDSGMSPGPGGTLTLTATSVGGTLAGDDLTITYSAYIIDTLDETNCATEIKTNMVTLDAEHPDNNTLPQLDASVDVEAKHIAVQKGASGGPFTPGDTVTYTVNFQVSDFGTADSLVLTDLLPDGVTFDSFGSLNVGGPVALVPGVTAFADGTTQLVFDIHAVTGNLAPGTTGTLTYTATIDQFYDSDQDGNPGNDPDFILAADSVSNTIVGDYTLTAGAVGCSDGSAATISIRPVDISKIIVNPQPQYEPGDVVTFRLTMEVPSGDTEGIIFEDFFPLPVFDVDDIDLNTNLAANTDISLGPSDTLALTPTTITIDSAENSLQILWPDITTVTTQTIQVDIDVTVTDDPFADDLFLTNIFQASSVNTDNIQAIGASPAQIRVRAPDLFITKGVSATDNPNSNINPAPGSPVDSNLEDADAGDTVTFTITIENQGGAEAHEVTVVETTPTGFVSCGSVSVEDGDGNVLAFTGDLFGAGLVITPTLAGNDGTLGTPFSTDTAIITYTCTLDTAVVPTSTLNNVASVTWRALGGAASAFTARTDDADTTIAGPSVAKSITAISPGYAGNLTDALIGEVLTYQAVITIPEGTQAGTSLVDTLDTGLAFIDVVSITPSSGDVTTDIGGGFPGVLAAAVISPANATGDTVLTLDFGTVTNANTDDNTAETITVTYRARVLNISGNNRGTDLANDAVWDWTDRVGPIPSDSATVNLTEPTMQVDKSMTSAGDSGDIVTVTLDISHTGASDADAADVTLEDIIPAGLTYVGASLSHSAGLAPDSIGEAGGTITVVWNSFPDGSTSQITFNATVDGSVTPGLVITNTASLEWESLRTADQPLASPPNNTNASERTGDGTGENDYNDSDNATFTATLPSISKSISSISPGGAPGNITNGDVVTYDLTVTLNEGTIPGLIFTDTLPPGLEYVAASAAVDTTGFAGTVANGGVPVVDDTGGDVTTTGQIVTLSFPGNTSVTGDNNPANNSFTVSIDARVRDLAANAATVTAQTKTNTGAVSFTAYAGAPLNDTAAIDFVEPVLTITKTMSPDTGLDAGDTVTITLEVENTGTGPAHDVVVSDILNDGGEVLFDLTSVSEGITPAGFTFDFTSPTVSYDNPGTVAAGATVTFTFTADVRDDVITGSDYDNTGSVTGDTQTGTVTEERTTNDSDTDTATVSSASVAKALTATSENSSDPGDASLAADPAVVVGEVLDYSLTYTIPEGVTGSVILIDLLPTGPAGLTYVANSATLERNSTDLSTANDPGSINAAAVDTPVAVTLDEGTPGQLRLDLGDVTNVNGVNGSSETLTINLQLVVANIAGNVAGTGLDNTARISFDDEDSVTMAVNSSAVSVHVAEPTLSVTKGASPATPGGGDTVTFTVTVANTATGANASTAFDGVLSDMLPTRYKLAPAPSVTNIDLTNTAMTGGDVVASFTGRDLSGTFTALAPGESFEITYTASIDENTPFGETVTNTFSASGTSTPGTQGTGSATPGNPGDADGERIGTDAANMAATDDASISLDQPNITKTTLNPQTRYAIGESADFRITVGVPVGATTSFVVDDVLDAGLSFDVGTLSVTVPVGVTAGNAPATEANAAFFTQAGQNLEFDFGTLTATSGANILIEYSATVTNVIGNQSGTSLDNSAQLTFDDPDGPGSLTAGPVATDTPVVVGEPNLNMVKTITNGAAGKDAGDSIAWRVTIENTGNTTAFQVDWTEILPDGVNLITNASLGISGGDIFLNGTATPPVDGDFVVSTTTNTDDTLDLPNLQIDAGATLTVDFESTIMNTVTPGQVINNVTTATHTSLVGGGRDNSTDPGNVDDDDDTDLNNYEESASQNFTVDSTIAIDKTIDKTTATIGETLVYTIRVDLIQGTTPSVEVTDILPVGVTYQSHIISAGHMGMSFGNAGFNTRLGTGQTVMFDFGDVSNPANADATDDFFTIAITVQVDNILANQRTVVLSNGENADSSEVYVEFGAGPTRIDFDEDGGTGGNQGVDLTIVEPVLSVTKSADTTNPSLGDLVTYTIDITHTGDSGSDAFDLTFVDTLPIGLTYINNSVTLPATQVSAVGQVITFSITSLTLAANNTSFTYQVRVDSDATVGVDLTNDLVLTWASTSGGNGDADDGRNGEDGVGGLNDYVASDDVDVTPQISAFIDAQKTVAIIADAGNPGLADPGDTLEYTVTLTNEGAITTTSVVFTDTIPANTTYAGSITTTEGVTDASGAPDLVVTGIELDPAETVTITFTVTVDGGTPAGTVLSNQGFVDSDQTVPEPTDEDGNDDNGDQPTDITVGGPPALDNGLYAQKIVTWLTDSDADGTITPLDVMRYSFFLNNLGDEALTGVTLTDVIPTGLTPVGASETTTSGMVTVMGQNLSLTGASIPIKGQITITVDVTIDSPLVDFNGINTVETFTNQGTADSDQTDSVLTDSNGDPSDGPQPTSFTAIDDELDIIEIDVEKRWSLLVDNDGDGLVDPLDTIAYTIVVSNTGATPANDLRLTDTIPANLTVVTGSVATSQGIVVTEDPVDINFGSLAPSGFITISFACTVDGGTPDGTIIPNQATVTGDGGINEPSDDNGDDSDGKNPTLTPVDTGGGSGAGSPSGLDKTLFATSEAGSTGTAVLIGEIITWRINVDVPAGLTRQLTISDTLPTGISYISGSAQLLRTFDTGLASSLDPGGINSETSGTLTSLADGSDIDISGQDITLELGDVINSDTNGNENYILQFQALVTNTSGNLAGVTRTNSATISWLNQLNQPQTLTPDTSAVTINEPALQIAKSVDPASLLTDGGTTQFTIVVTNPTGANVATAYDVNITDPMTALWDSISISSITPAGGVSGITDNSAGSNVDIDVSTFPANGTLTIVFDATTVAGPLATGTDDNTASITWTSLPGAQGTGNATPGNSGDADGERNGSGGVNDFAGNDTATTSIGSVNLTKSIDNVQTRYAIGDTVEYRVVITIPAGLEIDTSIFTDSLGAGLTYITGSYNAVFEPDLGSTLTPADFNVAGQDLDANFGTVTNSNLAAATLTITYDARVDNIIGNQDGTNLGNTGEFSFDSPGGGGTISIDDSETIVVGEPTLTLSKTITTSTADLDAGDTLTYRIDIANTGTTTAFDTVVSDVLPTGLENVTALSVVSTSGGAETPSFTNNGTDWNTSAFDVPAGGTIRIEFTAELTDMVLPGQSIQNDADASYTSRDGADANERDGSGGINDYTVNDLAPAFTVADPVQIDKAFHPDPANTTYAIGESVVYRLTITLIEGDTDDVVVTDTLPDGVQFESALVGFGNMGMTASINSQGQVGQVLTFNLGDIANPSNGNDTDDFVTIDITTTLLNTLANQDGTVLGNNASLDYTDAGGAQSIDYDADNITPGVQPLDLTIVEPELTMTKIASTTSPSLGDIVTFTITITHTAGSTSDAFDLTFTDTLPAGLTYINNSVTAPASQDSVAGQVLTFSIASLTLADNNTNFTYQASVDNDAVVGDPLTNDLDLVFASIPGGNGDADGGRNGEDGVGNLNDYTVNDSATITPQIDAFIDAQKTVAIIADASNPGVADPGDTLEYTVTLTNEGAITTTNVIFTDTIPANTTYAGSITSTEGVTDDTSAPDLQVTGITLDPTESVTITFTVTVDAGTPEGTVLSNQGFVDSDQTVPEPTDEDGNDGNGDQPTDITVGGPPALDNALYAQKTVALLTDTDVSSDISPTDVMRYSFFLNNLGDQALTSVTLTDVIPTGLTPVAASETTTSGVVNVVGQNLSLTGASIPIKGQITITVDVTIDDPLVDFNGAATDETFTNQGTADSDQTESVLTDGNGDPSDGNQPTSFVAVDGVAPTPAIDVEKRWSLLIDLDGDGLVDPLDTIRYQITVSNISAATATNLRLTDPEPADLSIVTGSVATSQGIVVTEIPVDINLGDLAPAAFATISFDAVIDGGTADGTIIPNQATVTGDNGINEPSDDNGDDSDGKNPTLTPVDTGGGSGAGSPGGLNKFISATSEADSTNPDVLIGEIITWRVSIDVPAGLTRQLTITDTLPTGLAYIAGSAQLLRVFDTGLASSLDPGSINSAATGVLTSLADGSDIDISGQVITLELGDIINSDTNGNESYVLQFQALVTNTSGNQAGTSLSNSATISWLDNLSQPQSLTPVTDPVTVNEPALQIAKSVDPASLLVDGGTTIFTLVVTNPSGADVATAYDVNITDPMTALWSSISVVSITPANGVSGVTDNSAGSTIDVDVSTFPADGTLTIVFEATTVAGPLATGTDNNTATITWTSLPGLQGTSDATPGNSGDADGERSSAGGVNDYTNNDNATTSIGQVNLTKTVENLQTRYAIGDLVEYRVVVSIPAGLVADNSLFTDTLDAGLSYVAGTYNAIFSTGLNSTLTPVDFTVNSQVVEADFGTVTNTTGAAATLTVEYLALVENVVANQEGANLGNFAEFSFDSPGGGGTLTFDDTTSITVGEPVLTLSKTIITSTVGLDAGDTLTYRIDIGNTGTTTAFDVLLTDTLPVGLENVTALSVTSTSGGAETPLLTNNGSDWATDAFDVPAGGTVQIEFTAQLTNTVLPGQSIQNEANATYTSRDGADANERDGSGGVNDYAADDPAPAFVVNDPVQIDKTFHPDPTRNTYTIGDLFTYRLTIQLIEGSLEDVVVTDVLPDGVRFESALVGLGNLGMSTTTNNQSQVGQTLTFDLGDISNPANADDSDDFFTVDISVTLTNTLGNQNGTVLGNNASVAYTDAGGAQIAEFDADAGTPGVQPLELTVVEPELTLTKSADTSNAGRGDFITFTLTLDHDITSGADAHDIRIVDTLPVGLTYVIGSASITPIINGNELIFEIPVLTLVDDSLAITYQARIEEDVDLGTLLTNTANAVWTSQPGDNPDERTGEDGAGGLNDYESEDDHILTVTDSVLTATKAVALLLENNSDGLANPGETLRYTVVLENIGNATATGVLWEDTPDPNTTILPPINAPGATIIDGNTPGDTQITVLYASLDPGATHTFTFDVRINEDVVIDQVINQGQVSSNENQPTPSDDPDTPDPDDPTVEPVFSQPIIRAEKTDSLFSDNDGNTYPSAGDELLYSVLITNDGGVAASNVTFSDIPDANTSLVSGSVTTTQGSVTSDAGSVGVDIGALASGASVTVTFRVLIDDPLPEGLTQVANQGIVMSDDTPDTPTDDPDTPDSDDPTVTPVSDDGAMSVSKSDQLIDNDASGFGNAGDGIRYTVIITNTSNVDLLNTVFTDVPGSFTSLTVGSVVTSQGSVTSGNTAGDASVTVDIGTIAPGASVTILFDVLIDDPLPPALDRVANQGIATADNATATPSDDPDVDGSNQPTETPVGDIPLVDATKSVLLLDDADASGSPSSGDSLVYVVTIVNNGVATALNVTYIDTPDQNTTITAGSVVVSQGAVTSGNDGSPPIGASIGNLPAGAKATLSYIVTINDPVTDGTTELVNQGSVSGDNFNPIPTDDPTTLPPDDPTVLPLDPSPILSATKIDVLSEDLDGDGFVSPGDTLTYLVVISNSGNAGATSVSYTDTPDVNTTLIPGSVTTSLGSVTSGNGGAPPIVVDIGSIPAGQQITISYQVSINNPLPIGVVNVQNQGVISSNELPDFPTDDPDAPDEDDPTVTPVVSGPILSTTKTDALFDDLDMSGDVSAGDELEYTITITNNGNQEAVNTSFSDTIGPNISLISGTVVTSQGSVTTGNTPGDLNVAVNVGSIASGGASVTITFRVLIDNPLPAGVTQVANQGIVSGDNIIDTPTDDPDLPGDEDPTPTPLGGDPALFASKSDSLLLDLNGDGNASPGDHLRYTTTITNLGSADATGVIFTDGPDIATVIIPGSVTTSQGVILEGNTGLSPIIVAIGELAPGASATVTFDVSIAIATEFVRNQGVVSSEELPDVPTDDPDEPGSDDPTDTPVIYNDLELVKTVNNDNPDFFSNITYTIELTNNGPSDATNIRVNDRLPAGVLYVSHSGGDYNPDTHEWVIDALASGDSTTLSITAQAIAIGIWPNTAEVIASDQFDIDSTPNNRDESEDDQSTVGIIVDTAVDLVLSKVVDTPVIEQVGQIVTFTLDLTNLGPVDATQVQVQENIPTGLNLLVATPSKGSYDLNTDIWTVGDLAVDEIVSLTLQTQVTDVDDMLMAENSAVATSFEPDTNPDDNSDTAIITSLSAVPTLSQWMLIIFIGFMMAAAIKMRRKRVDL